MYGVIIIVCTYPGPLPDMATICFPQSRACKLIPKRCSGCVVYIRRRQEFLNVKCEINLHFSQQISKNNIYLNFKITYLFLCDFSSDNVQQMVEVLCKSKDIYFKERSYIYLTTDASPTKMFTHLSFSQLLNTNNIMDVGNTYYPELSCLLNF